MPSDLTRPIIGIQNRTAQEVFDIMCDRFRALPTITPAEVGGLVDAQTEARAIVSAILVDERLAVGYQIETLADAIVEHIATALAAKDAELATLHEADGNFWEAIARAERAEAEMAATKVDRDDWINRCRASVMAFDEQKARAERAEAQRAEARKALDALDRMSRGVDWCDQDEQARRWEAARRILSALEPAAPEAAATDSIAVEICDAVMDWMVYRELIDTDQEYQPAEIVEALEGMFTDPTAAPEGQQPVAEAVEPSGNTGELIDKMAEAIRGDTVSDDTPWATLSEDRKIGWRGDAERALAVVKEYLTARLPAPEGHHPDDIAVDRFAAAMKEKLARKREEGRGGWDDKEKCSGEYLSRLLREHVDKGDPVDVGNLAMMLHQRGERIAPEGQQDAEPDAPKARRLAEMAMDFLHHDADQETYDRHVAVLTKKFARLTRGRADPATRPVEQAVTEAEHE